MPDALEHELDQKNVYERYRAKAHQEIGGSEPDGPEVQARAAELLGRDLMRGDPGSFKMGYSAPNAALTALEIFPETKVQLGGFGADVGEHVRDAMARTRLTERLAAWDAGREELIAFERLGSALYELDLPEHLVDDADPDDEIEVTAPAHAWEQLLVAMHRAGVAR